MCLRRQGQTAEGRVSRAGGGHEGEVTSSKTNNLGEILVPVMKELASSSGTLDEVFAAAGSGAKDTGTAAKDEEAAHVP